ncbi:hypothetical protein KSS87_023491, partial [Heliosperma pusillum]
MHEFSSIGGNVYVFDDDDYNCFDSYMRGDFSCTNFEANHDGFVESSVVVNVSSLDNVIVPNDTFSLENDVNELSMPLLENDNMFHDNCNHVESCVLVHDPNMSILDDVIILDDNVFPLDDVSVLDESSSLKHYVGTLFLPLLEIDDLLSDENTSRSENESYIPTHSLDHVLPSLDDSSTSHDINVMVSIEESEFAASPTIVIDTLVGFSLTKTYENPTFEELCGVVMMRENSLFDYMVDEVSSEREDVMDGEKGTKEDCFEENDIFNDAWERESIHNFDDSVEVIWDDDIVD